ncbi:NIPSNAP family protein [Luteimonas sp. R10]|uniref:NIPSNAP family protein n=1 Tax=Luteimonas sp. R10 TaxID=3108176 RepID=UPI0030882165|nr:NIPSNAP family protein [Luteimonas sp. R10]
MSGRDVAALPAVVELRRYALHPSCREALIDLFERELVAPQEACGMRLLGRFRDLDVADRFVWLRGFPGMEARRQALAGFYGGPAWRRHRDAANATMIDSDDVLLLRPVLDPADLGATGAETAAGAEVIGAISRFDAPLDPAVPLHFRRRLWPRFAAAGAALLGGFASEYAPNDFPALPVREGEHVFAWFARVPVWDDAMRAAWQADAPPQRPREHEVMRLRPTTGSPW